jgi:hypothetical protein
MCIKTFTKQDLDILGYQFVIHENMNFAEYQMSHKGAAGKAFSAHMPIYIEFFGLSDFFKTVIERSPESFRDRNDNSKGFIHINRLF